MTERRGTPTTRDDWQVWPETAAPISALGQMFLDYWHSKCPEGAFPRRSDIRPEELRSLLPHVFMVDILEDGEMPD
jgi:hypothetical protein